MAAHLRAQNVKRNKTLHRFYEPLILLYVLDRTQGDHILRPTAERAPLEDITSQDLRRRFLESLSYVCDFEKGGDTTTAISVASAPLAYYIACNKNPKERVVTFLTSLLQRLATIYGQDSQGVSREQSKLIEDCVEFSEKRLNTYWKNLETSLRKCREALPDDLMISKLSAIERKLTKNGNSLVDLCLCCVSLMQSPELNHIKERATASEGYGNRQSPFADLRHFVGRLAYHVKAINVLVAAALRLPALFLDPQLKVVECPVSHVLPPPLRKKTNLDGIVNRMISKDDPLVLDLQTRLRELDQAHGIAEIVRKEYANKNFKPCVHAELILLEHIHQNRQEIHLMDNDLFIGISKPSCYCCFLYMRAHPGHFIETATHQKIYINWMPPTSIPGVQDSNSNIARHELAMINNMVKSIRSRTIEQIISQNGRRQKHFDSVTGDTFSARLHLGSQVKHEAQTPAEYSDIEHENDQIDEVMINISSQLDRSMKITDSDEDSDTVGGVALK